MRTCFRIISRSESRGPYYALQRGRLYTDPQQVARVLKGLDEWAAEEERLESNPWPRLRAIGAERRDRNIQAFALVECYEMDTRGSGWSDTRLDGITGSFRMVKLNAAQFRALYRPKNARPGGIW